MNEDSFKKKLLCIVDSNSVRINENYEKSRHRYEATLFAEKIGRTSYLFKATKKDHRVMFNGCRLASANWRVKQNPSNRSGLVDQYDQFIRVEQPTMIMQDELTAYATSHLANWV